MIISLLVTVQAFAQKGPEKQGVECNAVKGMKMGAGIPDLTTEQQSQIQDLRTAHQKEIIPLEAELDVEEINLNEMIKDGKDSKTIENQAKKIGDLKNKLYIKQIQHRIAVRNLLTDEQKVFFDKMKHNRPMMQRERSCNSQGHECKNLGKVK
ncbi:Spy/CpxP family protein refolding chaperone [candidate division KSB1 bacterium]|nr:Spy/CpxP family protein refolding chaperone [candidate division KSB1 bacterium]